MIYPISGASGIRELPISIIKIGEICDLETFWAPVTCNGEMEACTIRSSSVYETLAIEKSCIL